MKHFLGGSQCIFSCQQLLILEQYRVNLVHTSLTLKYVYCYFGACSGKNLDFLCSSFPNEKNNFFGVMCFRILNWGSDFRVPYLKNLNLKAMMNVRHSDEEVIYLKELYKIAKVEFS